MFPWSLSSVELEAFMGLPSFLTFTPRIDLGRPEGAWEHEITHLGCFNLPRLPPPLKVLQISTLPCLPLPTHDVTDPEYSSLASLSSNCTSRPYAFNSFLYFTVPRK